MLYAKYIFHSKLMIITGFFKNKISIKFTATIFLSAFIKKTFGTQNLFF